MSNPVPKIAPGPNGQPMIGNLFDMHRAGYPALLVWHPETGSRRSGEEIFKVNLNNKSTFKVEQVD